jgi:hypothetical protein
MFPSSKLFVLRFSKWLYKTSINISLSFSFFFI